MGIRIVRTCDSTGQDLVNPVTIGFTREDGKFVKLEISQQVACQFVMDLANRLQPEVLIEVVESFFGKDWDKTSDVV